MITTSKFIITLLLCVSPLRAALDVSTGVFNANTGSATTTVTVTCQGKAIILYTTGQTAEGSDAAANASFSYGFSDGTNHRMIGWSADDNVGTTNVGKAFRTDRVAEYFSAGTPTSVRYVSGVAFTDATTTTITWDGTPAAAYKVGFIQVCGSDITNVIVGTQTLATSTGAQSVTGLAFQPDFGVFINAQATAAGTAARALGSIGFAASSTKEFTMAWGIDDAQNMTATIDAVSYTDQAACMSGITAGAETVDFLADFTSFNSDGYTVNVSNAPTAAWLVGYLLIKGGQWDVGTKVWASGTNTAVTVSGMAFQPKGLLLAHATPTADATVTTQVADPTSSVVGVAASTSTEATAGAGMTDAALNTQVFHDVYSGSILNRPAGAASESSVLTSFNSDGWTATTGAGGYSAFQVGWFAMGDNAAAPTCAGTRALMGVGC